MIQLQGLIYRDLFIMTYSRTGLSYKSNIQENQVTSVHRSSQLAGILDSIFSVKTPGIKTYSPCRDKLKWWSVFP